jgi:hypothetical protein
MNHHNQLHGTFFSGHRASLAIGQGRWDKQMGKYSRQQADPLAEVGEEGKGEPFTG